MTIRTKLFLIVATGFFILTGCARKETHGVVQDAEGKPVAGIEVRISGTDHYAVTGDKGMFSLPFTEGRLKLTFSAARYPGLSMRCFPEAIVRESVTKKEYPEGLDVGTVKLPCIIKKDSDGKAIFVSEDGRWVDKRDGVVRDEKTGLLWQGSNSGNKYYWNEAVSYCESLVLAGKTDWRLPARDDFRGLVKENGGWAGNSILNLKFDFHWTSDSVEENEGYAWAVHPRSGAEKRYFRSNYLAASCVH